MANATEIVTPDNSENFNFKWCIKNFNLLPCKENQCIDSSPFILSNGSEWCLSVTPKRHISYNSPHQIEICLQNKKCAIKDIVTIKMKVEVCCCSVNYIEIREDTFENVSGRHILDVYFPRDKLIGDHYSVDLTINFQVTFLWKGSTKTETKAPKFPSIADDTNAVLNDMRRLFVNQEYTDVTLKTIDKKIGAHRCILAARSPVFAAMFSHGMKEANENCVSISDVSTSVLKIMLLYIYAGEVNVKDATTALALYAAADKYQLLGLKSKCSQFLSSNLNSENVLDIVAMADLHDDEDLKKSAKKCILAAPTAVLSTQKWKTLLKNNPELAASLF